MNVIWLGWHGLLEDCWTLQERGLLAPAERVLMEDLIALTEKPVRFTLDLDQEQHGAQVFRALLDELQEGLNLAARVRARIWAAKR